MIFLSSFFISILLGVGFNSIEWTYSVTSDERCYMDLAPWDYDNDGDVEIAVAAYDYNPTNPINSTSSVFILKTDQSGEIEVDWQGGVPLGGHAPGFFCLEWADVNGDGDEDLVVGSTCAEDRDAYLWVYLYSDGELNVTPLALADDMGNWDVTDIVWGEYVGLNDTHPAPDLIVLSPGNNPQVIQGTGQSSGSWNLSAYEEEQEDLLELDYPVYSAQPWLMSSTGNQMGLYTGSPYALCKIDNIGADVYEATKLTRGGDFWLSLAIAPPSDATRSDFPCNLIGGNSWKEGVASYYELPIPPNREITRNYLLNPDQTLEDHYIEFVSDIDVLVTTNTLRPKCYVALAEAGQLDATDVRNRHGRIIELILSTNGSWVRANSVDVEAGIGFDPFREEAFSVAWCPFGSTVTNSYSFEDISNTFSLRESSASLTGLEPVYRIISAEITRDDNSVETAHVWYSGNGIFGMSETLDSGDVLDMDILSSSNPQLVFGRRGIIESWDVF